MKHVVIVGTGLIGASFGLALRKAGYAGAITGVSSAHAISGAVAAGAIDRGAPLEEAIPEADLVFLSQTIGRILDTIRHLDPLLQPARWSPTRAVRSARSSITRGTTSRARSSWAGIQCRQGETRARRLPMASCSAAAPDFDSR